MEMHYDAPYSPSSYAQEVSPMVRHMKDPNSTKTRRGGGVIMQGPSDHPPRVNHPSDFTPLIGEAPHIILNLPMKIDPTWTEDDVVCYVENNGPSDEEFQAHVLQYLKDKHNMEFSRNLNPYMPQPAYYGAK